MSADWKRLRRPNQTSPPGDWRYWLMLAGRGWGKTRAGAEYVRERVEFGLVRHIALIGVTLDDVRATMIEGESGLLAVASPEFRPRFLRNTCRLVWPNGVVAQGYSAVHPDRMQGATWDLAWVDELAHWPKGNAWDFVNFGLRGLDSRAVVTTSPGPHAAVRDLLRDPQAHIVTGYSEENAAHLHGAALRSIREAGLNKPWLPDAAA